MQELEECQPCTGKGVVFNNPCTSERAVFCVYVYIAFGGVGIWNVQISHMLKAVMSEKRRRKVPVCKHCVCIVC